MNKYKLEISVRSILLILAIIISVFVLWEIKVVIFIFFISFIIASALRPPVNLLQTRGVPRLLSILLIYAVFILCIGVFFYVSGVVLYDQFEKLINNSGSIFSDLIIKLLVAFPWLKEVFGIENFSNIQVEAQQFVDDTIKNLLTGGLLTRSTGEALIGAISNILSFIIGIFTVLVLSAYMVMHENKFYDGLLQLFKSDKRAYIQSIIDKVENKLGSWLLGQGILMLSVGLTTYLGLIIPGIIFPGVVFAEYAIPIAIIAAVLESVPNIGPLLTWVIALVVTVGSGGGLAESAYISALFLMIQQLENAFLVPQVMKKAVGIDPIVIILGIIAASTLFGIVGAVLVLPVIASAQIIIEEVLKNNSHSSKKAV